MDELQIDDAVQQIRKSWGIEAKDVKAVINLEDLLQTIATTNYIRGLLVGAAFLIKETKESVAEMLLVEADKTERLLSRQAYQLLKR